MRGSLVFDLAGVALNGTTLALKQCATISVVWGGLLPATLISPCAADEGEPPSSPPPGSAHCSERSERDERDQGASGRCDRGAGQPVDRCRLGAGVADFRLKHTGPEFPFVVNHLYRSNAAGGHRQACLLNARARRQILPVTAVGDDNFDGDVTNDDTVHDPGYDLPTVDGVFAWVRPPQLIRAQWSFDGLLDFVFVAGAAQRWRASAEIPGTEESYCPSDQSGAIIVRCSPSSKSA
jgi:hypothetical protein